MSRKDTEGQTQPKQNTSLLALGLFCDFMDVVIVRTTETSMGQSQREHNMIIYYNL